jgi:hypothetical protein
MCTAKLEAQSRAMLFWEGKREMELQLGEAEIS